MIGGWPPKTISAGGAPHVIGGFESNYDRIESCEMQIMHLFSYEGLNRTMIGLKEHGYLVRNMGGSSLNRTMIGLKVQKRLYKIQKQFGFESNYDRIERAWQTGQNAAVDAFESNYDRIESSD